MIMKLILKVGYRMKDILICTESDDKYYLVFDKTNDRLLYRICKFNNLDVIVNYYKTRKDVSNVIIK